MLKLMKLEREIGVVNQAQRDDLEKGLDSSARKHQSLLHKADMNIKTLEERIAEMNRPISMFGKF